MDIKKDKEKFKRFSRNFGRYIKVGVIEDRVNKDKLLELASFTSSAGDATTLPEYVGRMKEGQKQIYFVSGQTREVAASSPVLERLHDQGFEVLFALDQIDEVALQVVGRERVGKGVDWATGGVGRDHPLFSPSQGVGKYSDFEVVDAAKENTEFGERSDEEKAKNEAAKEELRQTCEFVKEVLGKKVWPHPRRPP